MLISQDEALLEISVAHAALVEATKAGVATWRNLVLDQAAIAKPLSPTTRANIVHNHMTSKLEVLVAEIDNVVFTDKIGFDALRVGKSVLLRFKYVGNGRPSNVATGQQADLARQVYTQESLNLLGLEDPPTLLTCGYTLDGLKLDRVEIRMDCQGLQPWSYDIFGGDFIGEPMILPGLADTARPAVVKSSLVRSASREAPETIKR